MDDDANSSGNPLEPVPAILRSVEGIDKLRRSIAKELVNSASGFDEKCSNLPQLLSIVNFILERANTGHTPFAVLKPFNYQKEHTSTRFIVDIVSEDRDEWVKVSARNPKSLNHLAAGGGGFGQRSIIDHANNYIECSKQNLSFFKPPKVTFVFTSGIGSSLVGELQSMGVQIEGEVIPDKELEVRPRINAFRSKPSLSKNRGDDDDRSSTHEFLLESPMTKTETIGFIQFKNPTLEGITRLNLDITAFLAYVSNLTNGHTEVSFTTEVLKQQLGFELQRPQKDILNKIFSGRELFCCQTALVEFQSILSTVGGKKEKERGEEFLKQITVVPDKLSERANSLDLIGNIKRRSLAIFGTGDFIEAVTVTANSGFVRAAASQGVEFPVFLHESRALTECKEKLKNPEL